MYLHGARPYFDILAGNAYGLHTGPEDRQVGPPYTNFPRLLLTREVMLRHGDGGKAVWVTEFGWNALPEGWTGDPSPWGEVSPEQQAEYIVGAYARARREWPWLGPLALWLFRQPRPDPRDPTAYFGLVDPEWRPRLAYDALRASAPPSGAPTLGPGVHQESAAGLVFGGTWQWTPDPAASLGALRESPISGATLRFRFRGTRLELLAPAGPASGTAYVKVNGASTLANRLPLTPTGQAFLDLYAPAAGAPAAPGDRRRPPRPRARGGAGRHRAGCAPLRRPGRRRGRRDRLPRPPRPPPPAPGGGLAGQPHGGPVGRAGGGSLAGPGSLSCGGPSRRRRAPGSLALPARRRGQSPPAPPFAPLALAPLPSPTGAAGAALAALAGAALARFWRLPWRKVLVLALAAALPLAPLSVRTPGGSFSPLELLLLLSLALSLLWLYLDSPTRSISPARWGLFAAPALLLLLAGALSLFVADYPRLALRELRVLVAGPVLYYFLARAALRGPRDALALGGAFLLGATGAAVLALSQVGLGWGLVAAEGVGRAAALYRSPNNLALLLDRALPLALSLALFGALTATAGAAASGRAQATPGPDGWPEWAALSSPPSRSCWPWPSSSPSPAGPGSPPPSRAPSSPSRRCGASPPPAGGAWPSVPSPGARPCSCWPAPWPCGWSASAPCWLPRAPPCSACACGSRRWRWCATTPCGGSGSTSSSTSIPPTCTRTPGASPTSPTPTTCCWTSGCAWACWGWWPSPGPAGRRCGAFRRGGHQCGDTVSEATAQDARASALAWGAAGALVAVVLHGALDNSYFVIDLAYGCWVLLLILELATEPDRAPPRPLPRRGAPGERRPCALGSARVAGQ